MPKCKNDPKASYSGNEPSPKGKGYCAHAEKKGATRTGNDGRKWTVATRGDKNQKYWKAPSAQPKSAPKKTASKKGSKKAAPKKAAPKKAAPKKGSKKAAPKKAASKKGSKKKPLVRLALKKPSAAADKRARTVAERIKNAPSDGPERTATIDAALAYLYWPGQSADVTHLGKWIDSIPDGESRRNYRALVGPVKRRLEKLGILVVIIPMRRDAERDKYWSDWSTYVMDKAIKRATGKDYLDDSDVSAMGIEIPLGGAGGPPEEDRIEFGVAKIVHVLRPALMRKAGEVLRESFGAKFKWDGTEDKVMFVYT